MQDVLPGGRYYDLTGKIDSGHCVVGLMMKQQTGIQSILVLGLIFIVLPLFIFATGNFPRRTVLKESISIVTLLAFFLMAAQFLLIRQNSRLTAGYRRSSIITTHKILGYIFGTILLVHPFLLVVPRYFEAGIDSMDAFITILTTLSSPGVVLGICTWSLMCILVITSLIRNKLPFRYTTWRIFHGILAIFLLVAASWHAIELGRHVTPLLGSYIIITVASGVVPLVKKYLSPISMKKGVSK